jgi:hypothetical protein
MDPNSNNSTNSPQQNAPQSPAAQTDQPHPTPTQDPSTVQQTPDTNPTQSTPSEQSAQPIQSTAPQTDAVPLSSELTANPTPIDTDGTQPDTSYVDDVGESLMDLLDDINSNENFIQIVANEMQLDPEKVKSFLSGLLDKIDKEQITIEELALIMAAPVVDEPSQSQ